DGRRAPSGRRAVAPPRGPRRPRHRGSGGSPFARAASTVLVALVMGTGAFLGVKLSQTEPASSSEPPVSEAYTDAQGHSYLWQRVAPPPPGKIYWGAFRLGAPYNTSLVTGLENEVGRRPAVM